MRRKRSGLTLIELVVIIGVLMGLLIPAVSRPRVDARRNQCVFQMKNIALAAIQHESSLGKMPPWVQSFGHFQPNLENDFADVCDPNLTADMPHPKIGTWAVAILPWLEAQPTYEHWTEDRYSVLVRGEDQAASYHPLAAPNLAIFQCPSNPNENSEQAANSYIANVGFAFPVERAITDEILVAHPNGKIRPIDYAASMAADCGVFANGWGAKDSSGNAVPVGKPLKIADFTDGQGHTVLFSENLQAQGWHRIGFAAPDHFVTADAQEVSFVANSRFAQGFAWHDTAKGSLALSINGSPTQHDKFTVAMSPINASILARPSSAHVDGVNASFADGATWFITDRIDRKIWAAMMTPAGNEQIPEDALSL